MSEAGITPASPASPPESPPTFIFRASITLPDGRRIYARQFGKRAFKIPVTAENDG